MIGIALLPENKLSQNLIDFQHKNFDSKDMLICWNKGQSQPHISLLHASITNYQTLISRLESYLSKQEFAIKLELENIIYRPVGWYFITCSKSRSLQRMHESIFYLLEDLIVPPKANRKPIDHYTISQRENYLKYGYRYILKDFDPHITIAYSTEEQSGKKLSILNHQFNLRQQSSFTKIIVFDVEEYGCIGKILWQS